MPAFKMATKPRAPIYKQSDWKKMTAEEERFARDFNLEWEFGKQSDSKFLPADELASRRKSSNRQDREAPLTVSIEAQSQDTAEGALSLAELTEVTATSNAQLTPEEIYLAREELPLVQAEMARQAELERVEGRKADAKRAEKYRLRRRNHALNGTENPVCVGGAYA
jgi:hypothetical protein